MELVEIAEDIWASQHLDQYYESYPSPIFIFDWLKTEHIVLVFSRHGEIKPTHIRPLFNDFQVQS